MSDESELATLGRRLAVLEQEVEGERNVSRHMFRKLNDVEDTLLDLTKAVGNLTKSVSRMEDQLILLQADLPRKLSEMVAAVMREELALRK